MLMQNAYGYDPRDLITLCYDIEGSECVVIRARCKPKNDWNRQLQSKQKDVLKLGSSTDVIDI